MFVSFGDLIPLFLFLDDFSNNRVVKANLINPVKGAAF